MKGIQSRTGWIPGIRKTMFFKRMDNNILFIDPLTPKILNKLIINEI